MDPMTNGFLVRSRMAIARIDPEVEEIVLQDPTHRDRGVECCNHNSDNMRRFWPTESSRGCHRRRIAVTLIVKLRSSSFELRVRGKSVSECDP